MKILLLADINSDHTQNWIRGLLRLKYCLGVYTFSSSSLSELNKNVKIYYGGGGDFYSNKSIGHKITFFSHIKKLKHSIKDFQPDIIHAHYATSYGLLGSLISFRPLIISIWGSDVFNFPKQNFAKKLLLKYIFSKGTILTSTSNVMREEALRYTNKEIVTIPFGVDCTMFSPRKSLHNNKIIRVGTVKLLEDIYGIGILIKAFKLVVKRNPNVELELIIVGFGSKRREYELLAETLGISDLVKFKGKVPNSIVPSYLNSFDVFVALSNEESFGVSIVEACSCGVPVVVTNVGGLPEIVDHGYNGFIVEKGAHKEAAFFIEKLVLNQELRGSMAFNARSKILKLYDRNKTVRMMSNLYTKIYCKT